MILRISTEYWLNLFCGLGVFLKLSLFRFYLLSQVGFILEALLFAVLALWWASFRLGFLVALGLSWSAFLLVPCLRTWVKCWVPEKEKGSCFEMRGFFGYRDPAVDRSPCGVVWRWVFHRFVSGRERGFGRTLLSCFWCPWVLALGLALLTPLTGICTMGDECPYKTQHSVALQ